MIVRIARLLTMAAMIGVLALVPISAVATESEDAYLRSLFVWPDPLAAPTLSFNPLTPEKVTAGRELFFDRRLSARNDMSCASCHQPSRSWSDGMGAARALEGDVRARRVQHLVTVGWSPHFGWDGGIDNLEGFVLAPIAREHEMAQDLDALVIELNDSGDYRSLMQSAFGSPKVGISRISQSLASFVRTIMPHESAFIRWLNGEDQALSQSARTGLKLFAGRANCIACHSGWRLTDDRFYDIGVSRGDDIGRGEHEPRNPKAKFAFKTPSLHGVAKRAPYMHDGSLKSLEEVVSLYVDAPMARPSIADEIQPLRLSDREKLNLLDFLNSL